MLCRRTLRMLHIGSSTQHLHGGASFICATDWGRDALLRLNQPVARHSHRWRAGKIGQRKQFMLAPYKPGFPTTPPLEEVMNLSTWFPMASEIWAENYAIRYYFLVFLFWSSHYFGDILKDTWVGTLFKSIVGRMEQKSTFAVGIEWVDSGPQGSHVGQRDLSKLLLFYDSFQQVLTMAFHIS